MSDPRNVAHAKKVTQEKKHHGLGPSPADGPVAQPGKKAASAKKSDSDEPEETTAAAPAESAAGSDASVPATLTGSLVVLAKLKELEFHSRAHLERLAELSMTVEDELKQKAFVSPLSDVYAAQSAFQTKLTALLETYKTECDRMQGENAS